MAVVGVDMTKSQKGVSGPWRGKSNRGLFRRQACRRFVSCRVVEEKREELMGEAIRDGKVCFDRSHWGLWAAVVLDWGVRAPRQWVKGQRAAGSRNQTVVRGRIVSETTVGKGWSDGLPALDWAGNVPVSSCDRGMESKPLGFGAFRGPTMPLWGRLSALRGGGGDDVSGWRSAARALSE